MIAMTACMDGLAAGGKWSEAITILDEMRSKGVTPNERTYKVCIFLLVAFSSSAGEVGAYRMCINGALA